MMCPSCSRQESSLCQRIGVVARWVLVETVSFPCRVKQLNWLAGIACSPPQLVPWLAVLGGH